MLSPCLKLASSVMNPWTTFSPSWRRYGQLVDTETAVLLVASIGTTISAMVACLVAPVCQILVGV